MWRFDTYSTAHVIVTSLNGWDLPTCLTVYRQELAGQKLHHPEDTRPQLSAAESDGRGEIFGVVQDGQIRRRRINADRRGHRQVSAPEADRVYNRLNDVLF